MSGRALVTGATGFIGGRLVEKLVLGQGQPVRALLRDWSRAARLARFELDLQLADLADSDALAAAVAGCDTVYHCAYSYESETANVAAAETLAAACANHGVRRLVFLSSLAVYDPLPDQEFDESWPAEPSGMAYSDAKLASERAIIAACAQHGTPLVVLQPTTVYGPHCVAWTIGAATQLRTGKLVLPASRIGRVRPVYVDDVVDAMLLASTCDDATGERFLIGGPDVITWHDYYGAYDEALGTGSLVLMEDAALAEQMGAGAAAAARRYRANPRRMLELPLVRKTYDAVRKLTGQGVWDRVKDNLPEPWHYPDENLLKFYRVQGVPRIDRARDVLGYEPRFGFDDGMALTAAWMRWANL